MSSGVDPSSTQPLRCSECSYVLEGLRETRCPECGARFDPIQLRAQQASADAILPGLVITVVGLVVAVVITLGSLGAGPYWVVLVVGGVPFIAVVGAWGFVRAILAVASAARFPERVASAGLTALALWLMPGIVYTALLMTRTRSKSLSNLFLEPVVLGIAAGLTFIFVVELRGLGYRSTWLVVSALCALAVIAFLLWGLVPSLPE